MSRYLGRRICNKSQISCYSKSKSSHRSDATLTTSPREVESSAGNESSKILPMIVMHVTVLCASRSDPRQKYIRLSF